MYTFRICPASAILSVPKSHGQHINMQICCMYLSRMSSVIPSASAVRMAVRILVYCFLCCTRRISAAWCSFPRRASGTAFRPTRTRNSFAPALPHCRHGAFSHRHRQMENQSRLEQAIFAKETVSAELVQQYARAARFGTHAQATFACLKTRFWAADTKPAFEKLSVPFLMIWGEENRLNPTSAFDTAEKMKDFGSFALFENTGALPHMENSKAFLENLNEFLNQSHIF